MTSEPGRDMAVPDHALVSVVFEPEVGLQLLQARSVARFVPPDALSGLVVIDNSRSGLPPPVLAELRRSYGPHADSLRVLRPLELAHVPAAVGWRHQQVLKLLVARHLTSSRYVVLDAKNHFVGPWSAEAFVAADGRMRARSHSYEQHPLRGDLEHVLRYLGIDPGPYVARFTATVTPFVLDVATVRELVQDLETRSGRAFASEFVRHDLTEFFLVAGWLVARGQRLDDVYGPGLDTGPTLWPRGATPDGVVEAVEQARRSMMFAVHRRALARLEPELARPVARLWSDRGLFSSPAQAEQFVAASRLELERHARAQRRRELPLRLLAAPRSVRRRLVPRMRRLLAPRG